MNKHQEHHHSLHHQDHAEEFAPIEMRAPATSETGDRESMLDELEKMMFERAR